MTITSAQGLTVDRTFLLADARPSRETIYPAATRHRERLDIYVNRAPLALDIADKRADSDREAAVTDTEIRAYLAERWSRSQPKEAALDYMADGIWEERREDVVEDRVQSPGEAQGVAGDIRAAANDNTLVRIARDVRRTAFGWRHAQTVTAFADGREQILAAYDDLREQTRSQGDAVALGGAFQEALTRHAVLLKQAETFRARPDDFASLLSESGGIAPKDLDAFEELHARARRHRRAATMRHVHRMKIAELEAQQPKPELRQGELELEGGRAKAPRRADTVARDMAGMQSPDRDAAEARIIDEIPPVEVEDYPWALAAAAQDDVPPDQDPPRPDWLAPYEALQRDWNEFTERVRQTGEPLFYAKGYADIIPRIQALAENPDIPADTRAPMIEVLENHQRVLSAQKYVEDYLDATERHMDRHASLQRVADSLGVRIVNVSDHMGWRQEADRLMETAEIILGGRRDVWRPSRQYGNRPCTRGRGAITAAPGHPGGWRICLRSQETGTAQQTRRYTRDCRKTRARGAGMDAGLRSTAPGLEQPHRRRTANRYPIILRQGLHGHRRARSNDCGQPEYPGQITGALDPGA